MTNTTRYASKLPIAECIYWLQTRQTHQETVSVEYKHGDANAHFSIHVEADPRKLKSVPPITIPGDFEGYLEQRPSGTTVTLHDEFRGMPGLAMIDLFAVFLFLAAFVDYLRSFPDYEGALFLVGFFGLVLVVTLVMTNLRRLALRRQHRLLHAQAMRYLFAAIEVDAVPYTS